MVDSSPQKWKEWSVDLFIPWRLSLCYCRVNIDYVGTVFYFQVTDLTVARDNQVNFEEYLKNNENVSPGMDLTVTVLTTGYWPSYKSFDLNLPEEMVRFCFIF